tara:strand:+ start:1497 stop:2123 length:627 start_codon:yes stop_codon:yes gene_type:complete
MIEVFNLNYYFYLAFIISYLLGSIPFGFIFYKYYKNDDIRKFGSGNIGATNINRLLGKKLGAITLLLDISKCILVSYIAKSELGPDFASVCGCFCILGHLFPIWLKFRGGKGVACLLGMLTVISWPLAIIFILTWALIVKLLKYSALGAIASIIIVLLSFKIILYLQFNFSLWLWIPGNPLDFNLLFLICMLIIFRHSKNIKELMHIN